MRCNPIIFVSFKLKPISKLTFAVSVALVCVQANYAQDLEKLYNDSVRSRDNQKAGEGDKNKRYLEWFEAARKNGVSWKCKNYFLFYDGYVFVGDKPDGSDIGKKPFDFVGISATYRDFI